MPNGRRFKGLRGARRLVVAVASAVVLVAGLPGPASIAADEVPHVLVFSATYGFRHTSITHGNEVIQQLADDTGAFTVEFTELSTDLGAANLRDVDVLLFNSTTGRFPLTADERRGLERFWGCGGGFVGVHAAADANYGWPEYAELIGAQFDAHPHTGEANLLVENADHPVNAAYAGTTEWLHSDEYYRWIRDVRGTQDVQPLLSLDEETAGGQPGNRPYVHHQPVSWVKTFRGQGRVYYNNLGHNDGTWDRPEFQTSLVDGLNWVSEVPLDLTCFDGDSPLPPPPGPPQPPAPDPDVPEVPPEPCVLEPDETRLTPTDGVSQPVGAGAEAPLYFGKAVTRFVLDLSENPDPTADVGVRAEWSRPTDDYDLAVSTPWGFAGSDAMQPLYESFESARIEDAVHCTKLTVAVFNNAALPGSAPTLTIGVNPAPDPGPQTRVPSETPATPGTRAVVVAPPGATSTGFVPRSGVLTEGGSLDLIGGDTQEHNIACVLSDPTTGQPLCKAEGVFAAETGSVQGIVDLPAGTYGLICQFHPQMTFDLTVVDNPGA